MILNAYTIVMLFIAILTGTLAIPLGVLSFRMYQRWGKTLYDDERTAIENRSYLLLHMATVMLFVKLLSWPIFYATHQSYVPNIPGVMCIFGITQLHPYLSSIVQIFKPVVFFSICGWLLLNRLDRGTETAPLFKRKFLFLSVVSIVAFVDSAGDLIYFTTFNIKAFVACCTTFFDIPERATAMLPISILGEGYERYMLPLYYLSNVLLIAFMGISYPRLTPHALRLTIIGVILALLNAVITIFAMFEVIAPKMMNLPYHHCIYCMWQYVPDTTFMTALFVIGTFSPGWALLLNLMGKHKETAITLKEYLRNLYFLCIVAIGTSLVMVTIHLLFKG